MAKSFRSDSAVPAEPLPPAAAARRPLFAAPPSSDAPAVALAPGPVSMEGSGASRSAKVGARRRKIWTASELVNAWPSDSGPITWAVTTPKKRLPKRNAKVAVRLVASEASTCPPRPTRTRRLSPVPVLPPTKTVPPCPVATSADER